MYGIAVIRELDATHFLTGADWGDEGIPHSHHYRVEAALHGESLDRFGYLVDITVLEGIMDDLAGYFSRGTLNHLPEFEGLTPSIEHFCRIWCRAMIKGLGAGNLSSITVRIWESETAWASYSERVP